MSRYEEGRKERIVLLLETSTYNPWFSDCSHPENLLKGLNRKIKYGAVTLVAHICLNSENIG